jgi:hypothetical protein
MVERFFFNGVQGKGGDESVIGKRYFPAVVLPCLTSAESPIGNPAPPGTKATFKPLLSFTQKGIFR